MKYLIIFIAAINISLACDSPEIKDTKNSNLTTVKKQKILKTSCNKKLVFETFKESVVNLNKNELSTYFDFPIENNQIWHLITLLEGDNNISESTLNNNFDKDDFLKHYDKIFNKDLRKVLIEVDFDLLSSSSVYKTDLLKDTDKETDLIYSYRLFLSSKSNDSKINMILYYEFYEGEETFETTINYDLIVDNCTLKIDKIFIAG